MTDPLKELYKKIKRSSLGDTDPYLMDVSTDTLHIAEGKIAPGKPYKVCSSCYSIINKAWDHASWCQLYKQEELSKWLIDGKSNK